MSIPNSYNQHDCSMYRKDLANQATSIILLLLSVCANNPSYAVISIKAYNQPSRIANTYAVVQLQFLSLSIKMLFQTTLNCLNAIIECPSHAFHEQLQQEFQINYNCMLQQLMNAAPSLPSTFSHCKIHRPKSEQQQRT